MVDLVFHALEGVRNAGYAQEHGANAALDALLFQLDEAECALRRVARVSQSISAYARKPRTVTQRFALDDVVASALRASAALVPAEVRVISRLESHATLEGCPDALVQIVVNLLVNAAHAVRGGNGGMVRIQTGRDGDCASLVVADDGPGVPEGLRARIFDPYFTTKAPAEGTGLGLAICRELAEQHGGRIALAPSDGSGATFELRLPLPALAPPQPAER